MADIFPITWSLGFIQGTILAGQIVASLIIFPKKEV
jgi:hypothetical protein